MPHLPASAALARFRVIDLTRVHSGPTACRQLADWGADVIQVQMPEHMRGDDTLGGQDGSDYRYTHRNKRSVTLNLKEAEGISVLKRLIATADVVVENFRPDVKFRLGIDYESLAVDYPRLVYASISTTWRLIHSTPSKISFRSDCWRWRTTCHEFSPLSHGTGSLML